MRLVRSVKIAVRQPDGRVLVLYRSETHPTMPHFPDFPGGEVNDDETIEQGALRELREETGLSAPESDLALLYAWTQDFPGVSVHRLFYTLRIAASEPSVTLSWEHESFAWQAPDQLTGFEQPYQKGIDYATRHNLLS